MDLQDVSIRRGRSVNWGSLAQPHLWGNATGQCFLSLNFRLPGVHFPASTLVLREGAQWVFVQKGSNSLGCARGGCSLLLSGTVICALQAPKTRVSSLPTMRFLQPGKQREPPVLGKCAQETEEILGLRQHAQMPRTGKANLLKQCTDEALEVNVDPLL